MKPSLRTFLVIAVVAVAAGGGYFVWQQKQEQRPEQRYKLHTVARGELKQSVAANGTLNPVTLVNVGTQVSGTVKKLYVDFNDKVEKGQVLLELDDALLAAQAKQSAANAQSALASLDLAVANEARMQALYAQDYVSRQELDQAVQAKKAAEAQLAVVRAQQERDRANLAYAVIRSPVSGVVVDRMVDLGQTVAASFQTPTLIKIAQDLSRMQIDSAFAEADIGNIRVGQAVRFNVDAFPNRSFKGSVRQIRINPTTQQNVVTYNVVVTVDNPEQILLPGMTAYVNIVVAERSEALLVPNGALRFKPPEPAGAKGETSGEAKKASGGRSDAPAGVEARAGGEGRGRGEARKREGSAGTVYVLRDGALKPVAVNLGITDNRNSEVLGGELKAGDQIVVGDNQNSGVTPTGPASTVRMRMF